MYATTFVVVTREIDPIPVPAALRKVINGKLDASTVSVIPMPPKAFPGLATINFSVLATEPVPTVMLKLPGYISI